MIYNCLWYRQPNRQTQSELKNDLHTYFNYIGLPTSFSSHGVKFISSTLPNGSAPGSPEGPRSARGLCWRGLMRELIGRMAS